MYPVIHLSTTKVMMQIIFTFVGYNILLILIVRPFTEGIVEMISMLDRSVQVSYQVPGTLLAHKKCKMIIISQS